MRYLTTLLLTLLFCQISFAQLNIEVRVLSGTSDSDCGDLIGSPDHIWSVKVNEQSWTTYGETNIGFTTCTYEAVPNVQYQTTATCPADLEEIEICFRAFENDPSIFNVCGVSPGICREVICQSFAPVPGTYSLAIPEGLSAEGELQFEIVTTGSLIGDANDLPCSAIDLGQIGMEGTIGDASIGRFNNYCGSYTPDEPNPADILTSWTNNIGTWFTFTTLDEPIHRLKIRGRSDPEQAGDPIFLQLGLFVADSCAGDFRYLGGSPSTSSDTNGFDEFVQIECSEDLLPNTTYYLLVDGVVATEEQLSGIFGLEVTTEALRPNEIDTTLCFGESLEIAGLIYDQTGSFRDTLTLATGCDTIIHADILVLEELRIDTEQITKATSEGAADGIGMASATGGAGGYQFLWEDGSTDATNGNLVGGETVGVSVTDANGCQASTTLFVDFIRPLMPMIVEDTLDCFGDTDGEISLAIFEGRPPYRFEWSDGLGEQSGAGILNMEGETTLISGLSAGAYSITVSDGISEEVVIVATVSQPEQLQLNVIENQAASCFSFCDARLEIDLTGGTLPYDIQFPRGDFELTTFTNLCAGNFQITVTDANNCIEFFDIEIEEPDEFIATAEAQNVSCFEGTDGTISISTNGNPIAYTWSNGATTANLTGLPAGEYSLTVTNEDGCEDEVNVRISEPTEPLEVQLDLLQEITCFGDADAILAANVNGPFDSLRYAWSNGESTQQIEQLAPATYTLLIENESGCIATDSFIITQPELLRIDAFSTQDLGCTPELSAGYVQVDGVSGGIMPYEYSLDGIRFSPNPRQENLQAGDYSLIVRDANACEGDTTFRILPEPDLQVTLGEDRVLPLGRTLDLEAISDTDNLQYTWEGIPDSIKCDNCSGFSFVPFANNTYRVQVFDPVTSCTADAAVTIRISREEDLYFPTAFSPNGDGRNDFFTIFSGPSVSSIQHFKIFDRRGHLVYDSPTILLNEANTGWDGRFRNQEMRPSVFVFTAEVEYIDGKVEVIGGEFSLVK